MELKYQCSKCSDYKFENEFSKNRRYTRSINYICKNVIIIELNLMTKTYANVDQKY
jgi:hypothetical protein